MSNSSVSNTNTAEAPPPQAKADDAAPAAPRAADAPPQTSSWRPPASGILGVTIALALGIGGALAILAAWHLPPFDSAVQGTQDAYVKGRITVISPQVSGYVVKVLAHDYQYVKANELLMKVDDATYRQMVDQTKAAVDVALANLANNDQSIAAKRAAVNSAEASVASGNAQLNKAKIDLARAEKLVANGSGTESELDTARAAMLTAQAAVQQAQAAVSVAQEDVKSAQVQGGVLSAQVESARAQQEQAEINLGYTEIKAPEDGQLSDIGVRLGQYVTNGSQLFFIVPDTRWVAANYKETQTSRIQVGQRAWFTVDALNHKRLEGVVEQISPATGSEFSILRPDNATGNFTKIPQRIHVRIHVSDNQPDAARLRPGMSVEAYVDTANFKDDAGSK